MGYINIIMNAIRITPILAFIIAGVYFCIQYKTYGSVSLFRTIVLYSFLLYSVAAYFLVILPLPDKEYVASLTTPHIQLAPFNVIKVFLKESGFVWNNPGTYIPATKDFSFLQPAFNILLNMPLGCYLRYYFKCDKKKAWIISLATTFFYELSQYTGLFGIYPRPYRLADIDDIMCNSIGSMIGFYLTGFVMWILPSRDKIDAKAIEKGRCITAMRRIYAKVIDIAVIGVSVALSEVVLVVGTAGFKKNFGINIPVYVSNMYIIDLTIKLYIIISLLYNLIMILFFKGNTIGKNLVGIKICDKYFNTPSKIKLITRYMLYMIFVEGGICCAIFYVRKTLTSVADIWNLTVLIVLILALLVLIITLIRINSKNESIKRFAYEKLSRTHLVSCVARRRLF